MILQRSGVFVYFMLQLKVKMLHNSHFLINKVALCFQNFELTLPYNLNNSLF